MLFWRFFLGSGSIIVDWATSHWLDLFKNDFFVLYSLKLVFTAIGFDVLKGCSSWIGFRPFLVIQMLTCKCVRLLQQEPVNVCVCCSRNPISLTSHSDSWWHMGGHDMAVFRVLTSDSCFLKFAICIEIVLIHVAMILYVPYTVTQYT